MIEWVNEWMKCPSFVFNRIFPFHFANPLLQPNRVTLGRCWWHMVVLYWTSVHWAESLTHILCDYYYNPERRENSPILQMRKMRLIETNNLPLGCAVSESQHLDLNPHVHLEGPYSFLLWLWPRLSEDPVLNSKVPYTPSLALKNDSVQPTSPWTCMCIILPCDQYLWEFHWSYHVCPMLDDPATLAILTSVSTTRWSWGTRMWGHRVTTSKYSFSRLIQGHGLGAAVPHSHLEVL